MQWSTDIRQIKAAIWDQAFIGRTSVSCPMGHMVAIRRRTHGMRNELYLSSRTGVRASCMAPTFAEGRERLSARQTETTAELIGWGPRSAIFPAWARAHTWVGQRLGPRPMLLFMTLS